MDDQHWVEKIKNQDHAALKKLYETSFPTCARFIQDNNGTFEDARDCFQNAMMALLDNLRKPGFQLNAPVEAYLYGIVRRMWLKELRNRQRLGWVVPLEDVEQAVAGIPDEDVSALLEEEARLAMVPDLLDRLKPECRELLLGYYFHDRSLKELAIQLGYTENFIKVKKFRCMKDLTDLVEENDPSDGQD